jgi:hypothetical protein
MSYSGRTRADEAGPARARCVADPFRAEALPKWGRKLLLNSAFRAGSCAKTGVVSLVPRKDDALRLSLSFSRPRLSLPPPTSNPGTPFT